MRVLFALALAWAGVFSGLAAAATPDQSKLQKQLQALDGRLQIESLQPTPIEGIYEVLLNSGDLLYTTAAGDYLLAGSLLQVTDQGLRDLTEQTRSQQRVQKLQQIALDQQVVFPAKGDTRAVIQIFTDITCPYCLRLHEEVPALNAAGVEVRYLAFPRQGPGTSAYQQLVNVWCAEDTQDAMNRAKSGQSLPRASCDNPVADQFDLARQQGIQGTPAIILPSGQIVPGYLPAARLLKELEL